MKNRSVRIITLIAGILLAVAILCVNLFSYAASAPKEKAATEQQDASSSAYFTTAPSITPPPSASVLEPVKFIHCLFEIEQNDDEVESYPVALSSFAGKFFTTLFRVLIAPNAP